jgi:hypothetical protein
MIDAPTLAGHARCEQRAPHRAAGGQAGIHSTQQREEHSPALSVRASSEWPDGTARANPASAARATELYACDKAVAAGDAGHPPQLSPAGDSSESAPRLSTYMQIPENAAKAAAKAAITCLCSTSPTQARKTV